MIACPSCGAENPDSATYCSLCHRQLAAGAEDEGPLRAVELVGENAPAEAPAPTAADLSVFDFIDDDVPADADFPADGVEVFKAEDEPAPEGISLSSCSLTTPIRG